MDYFENLISGGEGWKGASSSIILPQVTALHPLTKPNELKTLKSLVFIVTVNLTKLVITRNEKQGKY